MNQNKVKKFAVTENLIGLRLDKALSNDSEILTRSRAEWLIKNNLVTVNKKLAKCSYLVHANDEIILSIPEKSDSKLNPLKLDLNILFEDQDVIVINKPANLVIHPAPGHHEDTLVNALIAHTTDLSMKFNENRPGIVHRLDKDTSGVLVVAKNDLAHEHLASQFRNRTTHRIYFCVSIGRPKNIAGKIQSTLARHPKDRKKYSSQKNEIGKIAITNYELLNSVESSISYLKLKLETGRTHQIRVHLSELGCPIAQDTMYGGSKKIKTIKNKHQQEILNRFPRLALHAAELGFVHPTKNEYMEFKVDWPDDLLPLIRELGLLK